MLSLYKNVVYRNGKPENEGYYYIKDTDPITQVDEENTNYIWVPETVTDPNGEITFSLPGDFKQTNAAVLRFSIGLKFSLKGQKKKTKGVIEATNIKRAEDLRGQYIKLKELKQLEINEAEAIRQQELSKFDGKRLLKASELIAEFNKTKENKSRPATIEANSNAFRELIRYSGDKLIHDYSLKDCVGFIKAKRNELSDRSRSGNKERTAKKYYGDLKKIFNFALNNSEIYLNVNHFLDVKVKDEITGLEKTKPTPFTVEQFKEIEKHLTADDQKICNWAVKTGMRQTEITFLRIKDVNLEKMEIKIISDKDHHLTKTNESRTIELPLALVPFVIEAIENNQTYVFQDSKTSTGRVNTNGLTRRFKKAVRKAIGQKSKQHFHDLRITFGCWLLDEGVPVEKISKYLGHSEINTTLKYYADYIKNKFQGEVNIIDNLLSKPFEDNNKSVLNKAKLNYSRTTGKYKYMSVEQRQKRINKAVEGL